MGTLRFVIDQYQRVVLGLALLAMVILVGTVGYMLIEGWSFSDALFMAVITITTVGYGETQPLDEPGRLFTVFLILVGVGSAFYILTALTATIIEGDLRQVFGERRMKSRIERLKDHYIVCGFGRVGREVSREFRDRKVPFVVIDRNEEALEHARRDGALTVAGDATTEEALIEAGIERCECLIAASDSDAGNTYITLTAKALRPEVFVVARVGTPGNEPKMRQAGADRIVSPYAMGGRRMAFAALQPLMTDFMDIFAAGQGERVLAELAVDEESGLAGRSLSDCFAHCRNSVVLAIRDQKGDLHVGPGPATRLNDGDRLMVLGTEDELTSIGPLARPDGHG